MTVNERIPQHLMSILNKSCHKAWDKTIKKSVQHNYRLTQFVANMFGRDFGIVINVINFRSIWTSFN